MDLLKQAVLSLLKLPIMNPLVQSTAKHLSRVTLTQTPLNATNALHPDLRDKFMQLGNRMQQLGMPVYLIQVIRTASEQDEKYAQGRTTAGEIVTNAQGLESPHQFGLAADVIFQKYNWNPPKESWWNVLGEEGEKVGLVWGGRWAGFPDRPHFEHPLFDKTRGELKNFFQK